MPTTPELLAHVPLLSDLTAEERERLAGGVRHERHPEGATIVAAGSPSRSLYLLVRGSVQVVYPSRSRDFELAHLGPGDFFGEMALLNDRPRSATVRALEEVDALVLDQEEFRQVVLEAPAIALRLLGALSARVRNADERIGTFGEAAVHDTLTHLLNRRAFQERMDDRGGPPPALRCHLRARPPGHRQLQERQRHARPHRGRRSARVDRPAS